MVNQSGSKLGSASDYFARCPDTSAEIVSSTIVYKTKSRSDFWFGNYLFAQGAVARKTLPLLIQLWHREFDCQVGVQKRIIEWEVPFDRKIFDISRLGVSDDGEIDINVVRVAT